MTYKPGHHAIKENPRIAFRNFLQLSGFHLGNGELTDVGFYKIPSRNMSCASFFKSIF